MKIDKPYTFDRVIRILIAIIIIFSLFYFINYVKTALLPFLIAWLIAYFLNPMVEFIRVKLRFKSKIVSIITVVILLATVIAGAIMLLIPTISKEFGVLTSILERSVGGGQLFHTAPTWLQEYITDNLSIKSILLELKTYNLSDLANRVFAWIWGFIAGSFNIIVSIVASFIVMLYVIFILLDYDKITTGAISLVPEKYRKAVSLVISDVSTAMNRYFRGQALVAGIVGILFAIGFAIIGLPLGILLGLFIGMLNLIPYLQLVGIVPLTLLCAIKSAETGQSFWIILALAVGVMCIVQVIQDTYIVPKIMGKVTGFNPAIILLSLSIWGVMLGIIGMIIALPMTSLIVSYYKRFVIEQHTLDDD